ncbi:hypothetical protein [Cellulomonas xiejunii]|uniref:hypothetical protein n=1 Tax=Cellulomonas xiejunii TaxID=2968083 RepID=UPI001D0F3067|nr:hypothetical protein [Cellulomonas xiejunii]MCC2313585.1 hypothetical protein [Cellulomonas xiejunii]
MTSKEPDVSGWKPDFLPANEQVARHAPALRDLRGGRIADARIVWNLEHDEWFADLPVVLRFADRPQLEVCWEKLDDLSITWGTIDLTRPPHAWVDWPLEWRPAAHSALAEALGQRVRGVSVSSLVLTTNDVERPSDVHSVWLTAGLWLATDSGGLHIYNALDENGLSGQRPAVDASHGLRPV